MRCALSFVSPIHPNCTDPFDERAYSQPVLELYGIVKPMASIS
jgi:hypothetical protein